MLTLFIKTGCSYCQKVLDFSEKNGIALSLKNVSDPSVAEELITRGGKKQMPYLVDGETGTEMYESDDIIDYLHAKFAAKP